MRRLKYAAAAAVMLCLLASGCSENGETDRIAEYHVYSDGTMLDPAEAAETEIYKNDKADFYVPEGMETLYYSKYSLSEEELELYNETVEDLGRLKVTVPLTVDSAVYSKILKIIRFEQLSFIQLARGDVENNPLVEYNPVRQRFEVTFIYRFTADEISRMNAESEKAANEIMSMLTPDMDDYEKLKFFHDYLVLNCENSTEGEYVDTIYGALVCKEALCEGYAKAFSYLCNLAGIENVIVTGYTGVAHMWNMVKLNGNWYHVDVTWDNPDDELHKEFSDVILYQYFMVTDSVIENNHTIWTDPAEPPKAYGTEENYFVREGADVTGSGGLLTAAENALTDAVKGGKQSAMVKFATTDLYLTAKAELNNKELFSSVIERVKAECGKDFDLSWTSYYEQYRILTFIIDYKDS